MGDEEALRKAFSLGNAEASGGGGLVFQRLNGEDEEMVFSNVLVKQLYDG